METVMTVKSIDVYVTDKLETYLEDAELALFEDGIEDPVHLDAAIDRAKAAHKYYICRKHETRRFCTKQEAIDYLNS